MLELIKRNYWWPGIKSNIKKYVQGYTKYQQNKVQHMKKAEELYPLKIPKGLWQEISIDLTFVCTFSSLFLLSHQFGIIYWFWEFLYTEVHCIVPTLNLQQNSLTCYSLHHLILLVHFCSSSSILICNLLQDILLCHICNISSSFFLSLAFSNPLLSIYMYCSWNI